MVSVAPVTSDEPRAKRPLLVYLLGCVDFDSLVAIQRRLVYEIGGDRSVSAVLFCDHPPSVTIGREGSRAHIRSGPEELQAKGWSVRWVSRGGGAMLHTNGQVACYPILALERWSLTPAAYLEQLQATIVDLLADYGVRGEPDRDRPGVRVNGRRIAQVGVAIRDGITCFGCVVNANPDLELFRMVRVDGDARPMTSLARESPQRVRVTGVRQRLLERLCVRFRFDRVSVYHSLPGLNPPVIRHAPAHRH